MRGGRGRRSSFEPQAALQPVLNDTPAKKRKRASPTNERGEVKPPRGRDWTAHSQRQNTTPLLPGVFACAPGCKLQCQSVPDELRQKLRDRVASVFKARGYRAVAEELKAVTFCGRDTKQRKKHRAKDFFGAMVPGSTASRCAYCRTLPLAQQPNSSHCLMPFKVFTGCPNYDVAMAKEKELLAEAAAAQAQSGKRRRGRPLGVENNRYYFPSIQVREYEICRREMLHVMGQGVHGAVLMRVQAQDRAETAEAAELLLALKGERNYNIVLLPS